MGKQHHITLCQKIIQTLKSGFNALDLDTQAELTAFVISHQTKSGLFADRGGNPDFYYSIFGYWLSEALALNISIEKLQTRLTEVAIDPPEKIIDLLAFNLISIQLRTSGAPSLFQLAGKILHKKGNINLSYCFFLLILILDAGNKPRVWYTFMGRIWLMFDRPSGERPTTMTAAMLFVKYRIGSDLRLEQENLMANYHPGGGFRVLPHVPDPDMLSTAVTLFALRESGYDLRLVKPDCLHFIGQNYRSGAFLAGNGDPFQDLEYTFYGLLALGSLNIYHEG